MLDELLAETRQAVFKFIIYINLFKFLSFSFLYGKFEIKCFLIKYVPSRVELQPATTPVCPISLSANVLVWFKGKQIGVKVVCPERCPDLYVI